MSNARYYPINKNLWLFKHHYNDELSTLMPGENTKGLRTPSKLSMQVVESPSSIFHELVYHFYPNYCNHCFSKGLRCGLDIEEISHLQFVDDTIFFLTGRKQSWPDLLNLLKLYSTVSGLKTNKLKCSLVDINSEKVKVPDWQSSGGVRLTSSQ